MSFKFQLADLKRSPVKNIAALCVDSPEFVSRANEVLSRLMSRGNWYDTEWLVRLCLHDRCVTWPRYVGTVLGLRFCGSQTVELKNHWWSVLGPKHCNALWRSDTTTRDNGTAPIYNQIPGNEGRLIRYYAVKRNDVGKTIRIFGTQFGGQPLQELDSTGHWVDGITLTCAAPFGSTSIYVTKITSITREASEGLMYLYAYDPVADNQVDLAVYEPNETNPRYRQSLIGGWDCIPGCKDANDIKQKQVEALIKLEFIPLVNDYDFLPIDNFAAIKLGFQAAMAEEANQDALANVKWIEAVKELNFDIRNKNPGEQTVFRVNAVSGFIGSPY